LEGSKGWLFKEAFAEATSFGGSCCKEHFTEQYLRTATSKFKFGVWRSVSPLSFLAIDIDPVIPLEVWVFFFLLRPSLPPLLSLSVIAVKSAKRYV